MALVRPLSGLPVCVCVVTAMARGELRQPLNGHCKPKAAAARLTPATRAAVVCFDLHNAGTGTRQLMQGLMEAKKGLWAYPQNSPDCGVCADIVGGGRGGRAQAAPAAGLPGWRARGLCADQHSPRAGKTPTHPPHPPTHPPTHLPPLCVRQLPLALRPDILKNMLHSPIQVGTLPTIVKGGYSDSGVTTRPSAARAQGLSRSECER